MSLDPNSWRHAREQTRVGERKMFQHDCGDGNKLVVSRDTRGWSAWCFRCAASGWVPGPQETIGEKLARLKAATLADNSLAALPPTSMPGLLNYTQDEWPAWAKLWFYKAGLSSRDIALIGAGYDQASARVVLPLRGPDGDLVWWQARAGEDRAPKYLSPGTPNLLGCYGKLATARRTGYCVLTEDMLSAYKVSKAGYYAVPLCGTSMRPAVVKHIVQEHAKHTVVVWLDPDPAGLAGSNRAVRFLQSLGIKSFAVHSAEDPKMHTIQDIKDYIG